MLAALRRAARDRALIVACAALLLLFTLLVALPHLPTRAADRPAALPHTLLAVADLRGRALVVLDTHGGDVRRIALPGGPHELVRMDDGRLVVSLEQSSHIAVVDLAADPARVDALDVGGLPHGLALADGVLYFTDRARDALRRLDVSARAVADWRELDPRPAGSWPHSVVALSGGELAIAAARDSTLSIGSRVLTVSALPETVAVAPDGQAIATAGALGGVLEVFDRAGRLRWSAAVGGRPVRVLFAPDGLTVAAALSAAHAVALSGADGGTRVVTVGGAPDGLAFDAGGRFLFVGDLASGRVSVVDVEQGSVRASFAVGASAGAIVVLDASSAPRS